MKIYNYHQETGEFLFESDAVVDPKSPNEFLIPRFATYKAPPAFGQGFTPVFRGDVWFPEQDFRGMTVWDVDSGNEIIVWYLGPLKINHTLRRPDEKLISLAKDRKIKEILLLEKEYNEQVIEFPKNSKRYFKPDILLYLQILYLCNNLAQTAKIPVNNGYIEDSSYTLRLFTVKDLRDLNSEICHRTINNQDIRRLHIASIKIKKTEDTIKAYNINSGWR